MKGQIIPGIQREIKVLFELKQTERLWHIPVLASLCVGIPLLVGLYFNSLHYAMLSCTGGLVILYLPSAAVAQRMIMLVACSFGFMVSLAVGISFSFHYMVSSLVLALFATGVHWVSGYFNMKPPGSFFFIMIASIGSCMPFNISAVPEKIGLIGIGTMFACILAFFYSLYIVRIYPPKTDPAAQSRKGYANLIGSLIIGAFAGISILTGHLLHLDFPYWVPISCMAVMQGVSRQHIWQRSFQRMLGTFIGLGLSWVILLFNISSLGVCLSILILQFIIEVLVVRHYALAVVFITPMTILLAEAGSSMTLDPHVLIPHRLLDIVLGSLIGALGGWVLHHQQLNDHAARQIRKTRIAIRQNLKR